jgi:hypothetical protein
MLIPNANIKTVPSNAKYIVMSDCHRGVGSAADEFAHNSLIYKCALEYYLKENFTYIELGDAEELWENDSFEQIYITHTSVYDLLRRFHDPDPAQTRYLKVWGNHDEVWRDDPAPLRALFPGIEVHEAIMITGHDPNSPEFGIVSQDSGMVRQAHHERYTQPARPELVEGQNLGSCTHISGASAFSILLMHGHQADPICTGLRAKISRFFVRHAWTGLQRYGIGDPTRAAENPGLSDKIDATLYRMAKGDRHCEEAAGECGYTIPISWEIGSCPRIPSIVIAGHTHRPVFANLSLTERRFLESGIGTPGVRRKEKAEPVYYNTGSCVHPRCITGLEITAHNITLAKWGYAAAATADPPYSLAIARTVLEERLLNNCQ